MIKGRSAVRGRPRGSAPKRNMGMQGFAGLIYVGNVRGVEYERDWPRYGVEIRRADIFNTANGKGKKGTYMKGNILPLRNQFVEGDAFLRFHDGVGFVLRALENLKTARYMFKDMTTEDRKAIAIGERWAKRNLRWSKGSFCYKKPRK